MANPADLDITAPQHNFPKPEHFHNTKLVLAQLSYTAPEAKVPLAHVPSDQLPTRTCVGCWDGVSDRGEHCPGSLGKGCTGCKYCVGREWQCDVCNCTFALMWAYEWCSGKFSIGRQPDRFRIFPYPDCIEHILQDDRFNSCIVLCYLGKSYCVYCRLNLPHPPSRKGGDKCGSTLGLHQDVVGGQRNSQDAAPISTMTVGHPRVLTMALQLRRRDGDLHRCGTELAPEVTFTLSPAVEFELHNQDEQWHPRTVKKTEDTPEGVVMGSYLHGMQDQLQGHNASCGLLRRPLNTAAEVNSHTHMVIMSKAEKQAYTQRNLSKQTGKQTGNKRAAGGGNEQTKMFNGAPAGFEDGGRTAQECYEFARSTWKELAPRWADEIKPLLEQAVKEW